ncbi:flagellar hook-basal body complex protein [Sutcliffiella horikoshii]|uniref:flagellar hook-basal body complex protein n=1 Tax=Sutcliffiella horikoshii TaxID=79883 RepID=UPI0007D04598|nr:flagellar hook-basal body complex protein [Sutcliffiella horikoshii]MCM3616255.1 flagellar hook-basal body complex protein [Sutcliffiella horikoshii]
MLRSMYSSIGALRNFQTKLDVIGNNIANVNTYGFKKGRTTFQEMMVQQLSGASGPAAGKGGVNAKQIGLGSMISSIDTIQTQGSLQTTARPLDLALSGDGFFAVASIADITRVNVDTNTSYGDNKILGGAINNAVSMNYTRSGNFYLDNNGYIVNANGMYLIGETGEKRIPNDSIMAASNAALNAGEIFYDEYRDFRNDTNKFLDLAMKFLEAQRTFEDAEKANLEAGGTDQQLAAAAAAAQTARDNAATQFNDFNTDIYAGERAAFIESARTMNQGIDSFITSTGEIAYRMSDPVVQNPSITIPDATTANINDLSNLVSYAQSVKTSLDTAYKTFENFIGTAEMVQQPSWTDSLSGSAGLIQIPPNARSFSISGDGKVNFIDQFGNLKVAGQLMLAKFPNDAGLERIGENLFQQSNNSGTMDKNGDGIQLNEMFRPGENGAAAIISGTLEMSNVDLSEEFTEMITAQRGFQANTRIITTSDEILQELVNLKR